MNNTVNLRQSISDKIPDPVENFARYQFDGMKSGSFVRSNPAVNATRAALEHSAATDVFQCVEVSGTAANGGGVSGAISFCTDGIYTSQGITVGTPGASVMLATRPSQVPYMSCQGGYYGGLEYGTDIDGDPLYGIGATYPAGGSCSSWIAQKRISY